MHIAGFDFDVSEIDGCRIIESTYPPTIDVSKLSAVIASYYDLWDEDIPTAALTGLTQLDALTGDIRNILASVIQRTVLQTSFVGSAWYTGPRPSMAEDLRSILRQAGRPDTNEFESREAAIAYLTNLFREHDTTGS